MESKEKLQKIDEARGLAKWLSVDICIKIFGVKIWEYHFPPQNRWVMLCELYKKPAPKRVYQVDGTLEVYVPVSVEKNGFISQSCELRKSSFNDVYGHTNYRDFEISNLMAIGATNMLRSVSFQNRDIDRVIDNAIELENTMSNE